MKARGTRPGRQVIRVDLDAVAAPLAEELDPIDGRNMTVRGIVWEHEDWGSWNHTATVEPGGTNGLIVIVESSSPLPRAVAPGRAELGVAVGASFNRFIDQDRDRFDLVVASGRLRNGERLYRMRTDFTSPWIVWGRQARFHSRLTRCGKSSASAKTPRHLLECAGDQ